MNIGNYEPRNRRNFARMVWTEPAFRRERWELLGLLVAVGTALAVLVSPLAAVALALIVVLAVVL